MPPKRETQAMVDVQEVTPVGEPVHSDEAFFAEHEGRMEKTVEKVKDEDGPVQVTHSRPGTMIMYKPTENQGYVPRTVSVSALRLLRRQGWYENCPDCKGQHINKAGVASTDPNLCSARDPVAVRICPVCQKRIYDNMQFGEAAEESDDLNVIKDDTYKLTTGETRTRVSLNLHLWMRHPRQAQMMSIEPLPTALRDMVEEAKPV